ncbi:3D domain-containing protein [Oceanobacillus longus]|uniref:3D domain-containing protein n=1 Tax=Oceanobacillus longus TaxID=930120 RepID=A0ABV8GVB7_9BACI
MRKTLVVISTVMMIVGLGGSLFSVPVFAEPTNDLESIRDQRKDITENLSKSEKQITTILIELEALNQEIERANEALIEKQNLVEDTENKINSTVADISELEKEMQELEAKIEERYEILKGRMVSTQKTGGDISYLEVIFGSKDFGDFITRVSAMNKIADSDAALMEQQKSDMEKVEKKRNEVLDKLNELNTMKLEQEEAKVVISQQLQESDQRKEELETKEQELSALANDLKLKDSDLASLEQEVKQSLVAESAKADEKSKNTEKTVVEPAVVQMASKEEKPSEKVETKKSKENKQVKPAVKQEQPKQEAKEVKEEKVEKETPAPVKEEKAEEKKESKTFTVNSTAYTANCAGCSGYTATGINLKANPDAKVIAVDPNVIPLGSTVYVEGYGYATAGDTGGAIKGNKIDVFVPTKKEAYSWGVRTVKVTIVE